MMRVLQIRAANSPYTCAVTRRLKRCLALANILHP